LNKPSQEATKIFVAFQVFAQCVCVCREISRERALGYSPPPHPRLPGGRLKSHKWQKAAVGGKKSPANAGTKKDYLIIYRQVSNRWNNTISCFFTANGGLFERPPAAFSTMPAVAVMRSMALGDGGDDKEENSFSDWRHRQPQKGEADNSRHGFLYLYQPILCPAAGNAFG